MCGALGGACTASYGAGHGGAVNAESVCSGRLRKTRMWYAGTRLDRDSVSPATTECLAPNFDQDPLFIIHSRHSRPSGRRLRAKHSTAGRQTLRRQRRCKPCKLDKATTDLAYGQPRLKPKQKNGRMECGTEVRIPRCPPQRPHAPTRTASKRENGGPHDLTHLAISEVTRGQRRRPRARRRLMHCCKQLLHLTAAAQS